MLETHGYTIYKDPIVALRMVKDELNCVGSVTKFNIDKELIKEVKLSYSKYEADWKTRKALIEAQEAEKNKKKEDLTKQVEASKAKELLDAEIVRRFVFVVQNVIDCMWHGRFKKIKIDAKNS